MIFNLILRTTARSETKFVLVSVFIWLYTWNTYLQIFARSHAPYAAHFIRYIITTMFDFAGLEPVTHLPLQSVFPITPSVNINRLYSSNLKPQVTVVMIIFERSRASGSNRSTWKMKKMWLVLLRGLEPPTYEFWVRHLSANWVTVAYIFHGIAYHRGRGLLAITYPLCNSLDYQSSQFFISKRVKHYGISLI